jgi:hypothetical protein
MGVADSSSLENSLFSITVANQNDSTFHTIISYLVTFAYSLFATYLIWKWYNRNTPLSILHF